MLMAAERGFLDVVKWLYTHCRADPAVNLFWIRGEVREHGYCDYPADRLCSVIDAAAGNGHLAIVQYLLRIRDKTENEQAAKDNALKYPDQIDRYKMPGCTIVAMDLAAAHGHLAVVQWFHSNCFEGCTAVAVATAMDLDAKNGYLEIVKWLHTNRSEGCTIDAMNGAAGSGHLHVVKWLHEHRSEGCTNYAMNLAAGRGHFEMLKWLHENRMEGCTVAAMDNAATGGNLDIVKWLHSHGANCTTGAMDRAAKDNHLCVFRWLLENRKEGFTSNIGLHHTQFESGAHRAQHRATRTS
ncbi:putative ankyrin repeat protein [Phytophthora citrophthora]|uniref:Ankyrin repeat protein n=1 Tax=Phytophthora citrophthora TaxID=4793 RepID=A0AAD9LQ82_9STRA|nr:putative ankyrin repeat protein [Phytophthora citrophthora]